MSRSRRLSLAVALLVPPHAARAQPDVRPARPAALATPLRDDDLAWIAPLMAIQGGDRRRDDARMGAAMSTFDAHASDGAREARVERIAAGTLRALDVLRELSPHAVAPPGAQYDARCSGFLTRQSGGWVTTAAFRVADVAAAEEFYRGRGWEVLGNRSSNKVLRAPDGTMKGSLSAPTARDARTVVAENARQGIDLSQLAAHCPALLDGHGLTLEPNGALESEARSRRAMEAATPDAPRLPAALRRAGLTPAQWDAVWQVLMAAQSDEPLVAQPGALEALVGPPAEAARRRANVEWYRRNRAAVDAALGQATGGG